MCGHGNKMRNVLTFRIFVYISAKTDPETEVIGLEKTETKFKIPQPPNTNLCHFSLVICCDITISLNNRSLVQFLFIQMVW